MIAGPLLPYFSAKTTRGGQDGIAGFGTRTCILPWLGVLSSWNNGLRAALRNRLMTALGVVGAISMNARDVLLHGNLIDQARQHRCIAGGVVGHLDSPDFQRTGVNAQMNLSPLTAVV